MGSRASRDSSDSASTEYPHAAILRGAKESDAALHPMNDNESGVVPTHHKLTIWTGMVFIVGEMAGSGVLALPSAIENTGWIGLVVLTLSCISVGWCGILLGKCWLMLEERFPQYQDQCRDPYPSIGQEAFGKPGRIVVSVCIDITLFGVSVVFMTLAADNLNAVFDKVPALNFSPCLWMLIVAALLTPVVWLGTPKDFWPIAVGATVATAIACVILLAEVATYPTATALPDTVHKDVDVLSFALAFGTILFSFGGAPAFPTIQHDMNVTTDFPKALSLGFLVLLLMYLPVAAAGYFLLGENLKDNVLRSLKEHSNWMFYTVQALICLHLLSAFTIILNPLCQELEKLLKLPTHFTWKRAVFRSFCVLCVLFVAESVPNFGPILSLLGASTNTLLGIVLPCIFYLRLCSMENPGWPERKASLVEKIFSVEIILVGLIGGVVATYSAISALADPKILIPPCYINLNVTGS